LFVNLFLIQKLLQDKMNVLNLEECELLSDSKYRAYVSQVERALKAFEYTSEWADLISALGKLNKVHTSFILDVEFVHYDPFDSFQFYIMIILW